MALLAGGAEFFGGLMLLFGLLVRPASVSLLVSGGGRLSLDRAWSARATGRS